MHSDKDCLERGLKAYNEQDLETAVRELEEATRQDPDNCQAFEYLGAAYAAVGRHNAAIGAFKRATTLQPDDPRLHYNLGQAYEIADVPNEAYHEYCRALRLEPSYTLAWRALTALKAQLARNSANDLQIAA